MAEKSLQTLNKKTLQQEMKTKFVIVQLQYFFD